MLLAESDLGNGGGGGYAVGWLTLALLNAGLAQSKARSGVNWFLLSLLLGPVGTFLIVIQGPPKDTASGY